MKRSFTLCQKFQLALIGLLFPVLFISAAAAQDYSRLKAEAEKFFKEASFSRAHKIYQKAGTLNLSPQQKRWVDFRLADTLWRAQAGSKTADSSKFDQARHGLEVLVRDIKRIEERDRVWAEVEESLGDFWWVRRNSKNWGAAWTHYQKALDWWAGTKDIETARDRYTGIVWRIASPPWREPYYYYGYYGNVVPLNILENVLKIAQKEADKHRAHYLVAMTLRRQGAYHQQRRVSEEFEAAMQGGKSSEWYDDALNYYAEWLATRGEVIILENGSQTRKRDYPKALKLYRKLLETYKKGETRFYDLAKNQIENITKPVLRLSVSNTFLPGSKIQFHLNWRNLDGARLSLYPVDLTHDIDFKNQEGVNSWIQQIKLGLKNKLKSWSEDLKSAKDYHPGNKAFTLERDLSPGAYILEATGGGLKARDLILVTDTAIVLKSAKQQALVYFCDVFDGSPIPNAGVKLSERYYNGKKWVWRHREMKTDKDGLAVFKLKATANNKQLFAAARSDNRQAFSVGSSRSYGHRHQPWKVYVFTDRPAYRPKETAEWKLIARTYDGSVYHTPSGETIEYRINDPRGSKLKEGNLKLNPFGSAWGKLELGENIPLVPYQIT
ncbi:MAG: alpha-2-macroglobulin, partial [Nitrospinae bacterium]|nr:alpha-2-macroglobulin [Nitrospinota bacterium]